MRITPSDKYEDQPCSCVSVGCAFEDTFGKDYHINLPDGVREDGYLTLDNMNAFIRSVLPIKKKVYFKRSERIPLKEFLESNKGRCVVCVLGHFIYVNGDNYWSYFDNEDDDVVCVWWIK